jgi:hypothetical protein
MLTIYDSADMAKTLAGPIDPDLQKILLGRMDLLAEYLIDFDLSELANIIVVEPGDKIEAIEAELGISPFANIVDNIRYPDRAFEPSWEFCIDRGIFLDVVFALSDGGPGIVLLVPDRDGVVPELRAMLKAYATTNPKPAY